jgi:hypothetical protein
MVEGVKSAPPCAPLLIPAAFHGLPDPRINPHPTSACSAVPIGRPAAAAAAATAASTESSARSTPDQANAAAGVACCGAGAAAADACPVTPAAAGAVCRIAGAAARVENGRPLQPAGGGVPVKREKRRVCVRTSRGRCRAHCCGGSTQPHARRPGPTKRAGTHPWPSFPSCAES